MGTISDKISQTKRLILRLYFGPTAHRICPIHKSEISDFFALVFCPT